MQREEYQHMNEVEARHFWFRAKTKYLKIALNRLRIPHDARILDAGCGTGGVLTELRALGYTRAEGADTSPSAIAFCREKRLIVTQFDSNALPFPHTTFNAILCLDVLEHIADDYAFLHRLRDALAPGGAAVIMVPAHPHLWSYHDEAMGHYRRYTKPQLRALFSEAGFTDISLSYLHTAMYLPFLVFRKLKSSTAPTPQSDTTALKPFQPLQNLILPLLYLPEMVWFRLCGALPWGVSLILTARKPR